MRLSFAQRTYRAVICRGGLGHHAVNIHRFQLTTRLPLPCHPIYRFMPIFLAFGLLMSMRHGFWRQALA